MTHDDPLDAARGIVFAAGLGLIAWSGLVLLFVTVWRWL